ncbi:MAG: endonuclease/exonuclease/phosphatase family protein [Sphingomonas sp.]|nr:MAG: endonuclease/exonuclease/phosphatase family protein [Sphingomonas sp.]
MFREDQEGSIRKALGWLFLALALIASLVTLVSVVHSNQWWVQILNFPRLLSLIAIALIALGCVAFARQWRPVLVVLLVASAAVQFWRLYPYVPFAPVEVGKTKALSAVSSRSCFTALGLNVLQHNRDYTATLQMVDREQPDILLLMETDGSWVQALAPILARYPHKLLRPLDNTYGMVFASKLPVISAHTENVTDQDTPTVYARLTTRDGQPFDYVALHPRPPVPGQDTDLRDRKIERAALRITGSHLPAMAMGDFNDVAWSRTTQLFKQVGGYLDPRIGRGTYPTFPAKYVAVGWPLDQMFVTPEFILQSLRVLENVKSDHRPLLAKLCLSPKLAPRINASPAPVGSKARDAARSMTETGSAQ